MTTVDTAFSKVESDLAVLQKSAAQLAADIASLASAITAAEAPSFTLAIATPSSGATVSGVVKIHGSASGFKNVEGWNGGTMVPGLQATPDTTGNFTLSLDTTKLPNGPLALVINAGDSAPGTPPQHSAGFPLPLTVANAAPAPAGRNWAFFMAPGTNFDIWKQENSGWTAQPVDGLHTFSDRGAGFFQGSGWAPPPKSILLTAQWGTPGESWPGTIDMNKAAAGDYDAQWLAWLKNAAANAEAPIAVVRIWQEVNGNWFPQSVDPSGKPWPVETIIAAWRRMARQVRIALTDAKIEWNLSAGTGWPNAPGDGSGFDLYPGDDLVDVIGIDAYKHGIPWDATVNGPGVNLTNLVAFAKVHSKLIAVSETATTGGDGQYIENWCAWLDSLGAQAAYLSYFDQGVNPLEDTFEGANAAADRAALNASSFGTKKFAGTWSSVLTPTT